MRGYYCPICLINQQIQIGNELFFIFNRFTSSAYHYIHQILHHQIIPNTFHFQIELLESIHKQNIVWYLREIYSIDLRSFNRTAAYVMKSNIKLASDEVIKTRNKCKKLSVVEVTKYQDTLYTLI